MRELLTTSTFFGVMVSILAYEFGLALKKRFPVALCNPLLISIVVVIVILAGFDIDYEA